MSRVYTVSELNNLVKNILDNEPVLDRIYISGELSNYKIYPSGHHYFTLKDAEGAMRCIIYKNNAVKLRFRPENGMKVIAFGKVAVYPRDGVYQLYCTSITPDGVGELYIAFEQLKEKLYKEGIFDQSRKKPIPKYPKSIALITSPAGAAVRDMIRVLKKRYPIAEVVIMPVRVQGIEAAAEITGAIKYANRYNVADLIIAGRGGGSMEDLWCFNDERVARAIFDSNIPIISAVGHEPDFTIADFAADLRAATPSNGAELAVADKLEIIEYINSLQKRMLNSIIRKLDINRERLSKLSANRELSTPLAYIDDKRMRLDYLLERMASSAGAIIAKNRNRYSMLAAGLDAMSPLKVLGRGYSIAQKNDRLLRSVKEAEIGDRIKLLLKDGSLYCNIEEIENNGRKSK